MEIIVVQYAVPSKLTFCIRKNAKYTINFQFDVITEDQLKWREQDE
jgi:hypothetical protein